MLYFEKWHTHDLDLTFSVYFIQMTNYDCKETSVCTAKILQQTCCNDFVFNVAFKTFKNTAVRQNVSVIKQSERNGWQNDRSYSFVICHSTVASLAVRMEGGCRHGSDKQGEAYCKSRPLS